MGCLRLISGNRAWQDSTTLSKFERALFSTSTGCVSCRWTTHLTPNKRHFPQMQALGAHKSAKVPAWNSNFIADRSAGSAISYTCSPRNPATKITTTTTPMI